jgi:hypothetical protein
MITSGTITITSGAGEWPADFLDWIELVYGSSAGNVALEYADPNWADSAYPTYPDGPARFFATKIGGDTFYLYPSGESDGTLTLIYYQKIPALASDNETNWLLTAHPDLYLFGSLVEANAFTQDEKALIWKARRDEIFMEIERLDEKMKGPSTVRIMGTVV